MVEAYNLFIGGYIPKVEPKNSVHNRRELKNKYKSIVSLNNSNPLAMIRLSADTQKYALNVKELSMEMVEASQNALNGQGDQGKSATKDTMEIFNRLLKASDEYGVLKNEPSRPGAELRRLVAGFESELSASGIEVDENGYLKVADEESFRTPTSFLQALRDKADYMSMNPMEYVEKKVYSYAHLRRGDVGSSYASSAYSGMLFNSYC